MEVAPQELAQLLKLAGVGADPEPDMPEPEMDSEPEAVSYTHLTLPTKA